MSEHFIEICRGCGGVIAQCRCPGPKVTKYGFCPECVKARYDPMSDNALPHTYTEAFIETLTIENNHLRMVADNVLNAMTENQRLTAENERLRAALLPFARAYTESSIKHPLPEIWFQVSGAVCKQAADALETEAVKP